MPGARRARTSGSRPLTARFSMAAESTEKLRWRPRLHLDDAGADVDRLRHRAELEGDDAERQAVRRVEHDVGPFDGLERVHRHLQVVGVRQQVEEHEVAGLVGRRDLHVVAPRAGQLDRRPRHRRTLPVPHRAGDRTARGLRHDARSDPEHHRRARRQGAPASPVVQHVQSSTTRFRSHEPRHMTSPAHEHCTAAADGRMAKRPRFAAPPALRWGTSARRACHRLLWFETSEAAEWHPAAFDQRAGRPDEARTGTGRRRQRAATTCPIWTATTTKSALSSVSAHDVVFESL